MISGGYQLHRSSYWFCFLAAVKVSVDRNTGGIWFEFRGVC
jgi:hypothetical protein